MTGRRIKPIPSTRKRSGTTRMNRNQTPQSLKHVLKNVIGRLGIEEKLEETRVIEAWQEIAGQAVNAVTQRVWVHQERLYVKVTSSAWRQELYMQRRAWLLRLQEHTGSKQISEIVFR